MAPEGEISSMTQQRCTILKEGFKKVYRLLVPIRLAFYDIQS